MKPLVTNTTNQKQLKRADQKIQNLEQTLENDMRVVLKTPEGRRVLWDLLTYCNIYKQSFDNSGSITAFNEGRRVVGLKVLKQIMAADPGAYIEMQSENKGDS
jgi:hypothetical protein